MPLKLSRGFCPPRPLGEQPVAGPRVYPPEEGTLRRSRSPLRETGGSFLPSPGSGEEKTAPRREQALLVCRSLEKTHCSERGERDPF